MKKYYLVSCTYGSYQCDPFRCNIVISEEVGEFASRNLLKMEDEEDEFYLDAWVEITKASYEGLKRLNPTKEGYFKLLAEDYKQK